MNKKLFTTALALVFLLSFASAYETVYYNHDSGDDYVYKEKISKTYYDDDDDYTVTRTIYVNYDNEDRYSTNDYRHGYSYRTTNDYWNRHHDRYEIEDVKIIRTDEDYWYSRDHDQRQRYDYRDYDPYRNYNRGYQIPISDWEYYRHYNKNIRTERIIIPYLRDSYERDCYDYAPRGKLFYTSC